MPRSEIHARIAAMPLAAFLDRVHGPRYVVAPTTPERRKLPLMPRKERQPATAKGETPRFLDPGSNSNWLALRQVDDRLGADRCNLRYSFAQPVFDYSTRFSAITPRTRTR